MTASKKYFKVYKGTLLSNLKTFTVPIIVDTSHTYSYNTLSTTLEYIKDSYPVETLQEQYKYDYSVSLAIMVESTAPSGTAIQEDSKNQIRYLVSSGELPPGTPYIIGVAGGYTPFYQYIIRVPGVGLVSPPKLNFAGATPGTGEPYKFSINKNALSDYSAATVRFFAFMGNYSTIASGWAIFMVHYDQNGIASSIVAWTVYKDSFLTNNDNPFTPQVSAPYNPGGTSGPDGGGGSFGRDEISDSIFGDLPPGSVDAQDSATGMYTRYLMNSSYLDLLGDWVWDPNLGLSLIQTAIKPFFNDPEQALISLISFPFQLSAPLVGISTRSQPCYFGHQPTGATFVALTTQSAQINWGTIDLQEYWGNFLDYAPHTKIELYLPWGTGFINLDPGQCLPGTLTVITNIELQRGSCVHNVVNSDGCVIGSYAGQCGKQIPLISSDIAAKRAGLVTAAAGALVAGAAIAAAPAAMSGGYGAGIASSGIVSASKVSAISTPAAAQYRADVASSFGMKGAESALNTVEKGAKAGANIASKSSVASLKTPVSVQRNGGFTDGSAGMGIQYPYIILSRPEQNVPENYGHHFGYPSNVYVRLSSLRGYTEIGSIHLDSIPATNAELEELDGILKGGVIF